MKQQELYQKPSSIETENIIKANTELAVNQYATISAIKGNQFGREVFSAVLQFKDLAKFLEVFPEVQRTASIRKISQIKTYIMSYLEDKTNLRFFSGITVTARGNVFYDSNTKTVAIDTVSSKLSINDGQHRYGGVLATIEELNRKLSKARSKEQHDLYQRYLKELNEMVIPVVLFNSISEEEEKQLFYDLNSLSTRPSRSSTIRLSQSDLFSKLAREIARENHYLLKYGVEYHKMSIHQNNPNTILLTSVYDFCRGLYHQELKVNSEFLTEKNYANTKKRVATTLDKMFKVLPQDLHVKDKYVTSRSYTLRGICRFIYECQNDLTIKDEHIYKAIEKINWHQDILYWSSYGGSESPTGSLQFGGHGEGGVLSIYTALKVALEDVLQDEQEAANKI